jgi:hypothetical protein
MNDPIRREMSNVAVVGALFLVGTAIAGPVGGIVTTVASESLSDLAQRGWGNLRDRFLGQQGIGEPDLQVTMRRAYLRAVDNLEMRWGQLTEIEGTRRVSGVGEAQGFFLTLREEATTALTAQQLSTLSTDPAALQTLGSGNSGLRSTLRLYLSSRLNTYGEGLAAFVLQGFEPELSACFAEELKQDRPESNRAWRAYQRLVLDSLHETINHIRTTQDAVESRITQINQVLEQIQEWERRLDALPADVRERTGEEGLETLIVESRNMVLAVIEREHQETRNTVVDQVGSVRAELQPMQEMLLATSEGVSDLLRSRRRVERVPDARFCLTARYEHLGCKDT